MKNKCKRLAAVLLSAVLICGFVGTTSAEGAVSILEQIPDGVTAGPGSECDSLTGWDTGGTAAGNTITPKTENGDTYLEINRASDGAARASFVFSPVLSGSALVQTRVKRGANSRLMVYGGDSNLLATYVDFCWDANRIEINRGKLPDSYTNNRVPFDASSEWLTLTLHFQTNKKMFDVYLDNTLVAQDLLFRSVVNVSTINSIRFDASQNGSFGVDYVRSYTVNKVSSSAPVIAGDITFDGLATVGRTITASYTFSDPDGDREGDTRYQWEMAASEAGPFTAIQGATSIQLHITGDMAEKYLRLTITPVDLFGQEGQAVSSAPFQELTVKTMFYESSFGSEPTEGWTNLRTQSENANTYATVNEAVSGENVLHIVNQNASSSYLVSKSIDVSGIFTVTFDVKAPFDVTTTGEQISIFIMKQGNYEAVSLNYCNASGAKLRLISGESTNGNKYTSIDLNQSEWTSIKCDVNIPLNKMSLYINGSPNAQDVRLREHTKMDLTKGLDSINFGMKGSAAGELLYRNIEIYRTDPYNTAPVAENAGITGAPTINKTLTASYQFTDPDGDAEGESLVKWYVSGKKDGTYKAIAGAENKSYTVPTGFATSWIRCGVTPVDAYGGIGTETLSAPVYIDVVTDKKYDENYDAPDAALTDYGVHSSSAADASMKITDGSVMLSSPNGDARFLKYYKNVAAPSVYEVSLKNTGGETDFRFNNGEIAYILFSTDGKLQIQVGGTLITIDDSYDTNKFYDFKFVFNNFSGASANDTYDIFVNGTYYGNYSTRSNVSSMGISNIYKRGGGSGVLYIDNLKINNILVDQYPDVKQMSKQTSESLQPNVPFTYQTVIRNATDAELPQTTIVALYQIIDGFPTLADAAVSNAPLAVGDNTIELSVTPTDSSGIYEIKIFTFSNVEELRQFETIPMIPFSFHN